MVERGMSHAELCTGYWKSGKSAPYLHIVTSFIVICPTSVFTRPLVCFLLLYLFSFCRPFLWPWCCEYWVGSFTGAFFLFTSSCAAAREGSGAICLIGSFSSPMLWQSKCYLQSHCAGRTLSPTFHDEDGKSKMEIWPCAGAPGNEASLKDASSSNEMYSNILKCDPATLSHGPVEIL